MMIMGSQTAIISPCGQYRPWLMRGRIGGATFVYVMLNPSTADAEKDDPTIRRCLGFAKREGATRVIVVNLFTGRATQPSALWGMTDPVGPQADDALREAFRFIISPTYGEAFDCPTDRIICAWGATPSGPEWFRSMHRDRTLEVIAAAERNVLPLFTLGLTAKGAPRHPLYVRGDAPIVPLQAGAFLNQREAA